MRRMAWCLLVLFVFAIPWEYSLDLGSPFGNVARVVGLLALLAAVPAVLQPGRFRFPGSMQWLVLALFLWFCCTCFWSIDPDATLAKLRGFLQEMMVVWLVWEFAETPAGLRTLLRAYVAGSWVLALLTVADLLSPDAIATGQIRFVAQGQDPNDVARFLDFGFPMAALLLEGETRRCARWLAVGYLPLGLFAVLLTASRGGFLAAVVALAGCAALLARGHSRRLIAGVGALPLLAAMLWFTVPHETLQRLTTIVEQVQNRDLNNRWNIWTAGWQAFVQAPVFGAGSGSFTTAARLTPMDTAHNTALSIAVEGGLCALFLAVAIVAAAFWAAMQTRGSLRVALLTTLLVWTVTSLVATVEENRTTWLLFSLIAAAGRLAREAPEELAACFQPAGACSPPPMSQELALSGTGR